MRLQAAVDWSGPGLFTRVWLETERMAERRLAVVTGAARGIGRAIVFELLKQGRLVAGLDIMEDQLQDLQRVVKEAGFEVITRCVDITQTAKFTELEGRNTTAGI
jgi:NAD(P)-dependent dehydrogenase (short-subunit alcohol dehydrogenase family)